MKNRAAGLLFLLVLSPLFALATHLRAGEITVERSNCTALTFQITITVYTNTGSDIQFGGGILDFGDGTPTVEPPNIPNQTRPDLGTGTGIGYVSYSVPHTYSTYGSYTISYVEPNRNGGILNMLNSVETTFYIETVILLDPILGCNNSPKLLVPPIDKGCVGSTWYHNPGAYDPDGDSISFEMTIPRKNKGQVVAGYTLPNSQSFYDNFTQGNEAGDAPPTFGIDAVTGTITWDAPGNRTGEYNIAFLIKEWRRYKGEWVQMGYVTRDMQIIIEDCLNQRPELIVPNDICVVAGTKITQDIFGYDPDLEAGTGKRDQVYIQAFSQVFSISPSKAVITFPTPNDFQDQGGIDHPAKITFEWQTDCKHVKEQSYQVVFKITDKPVNGGTHLVQFKTWNIKVVGPEPVWNTADLVPSSRSANLTWDNYTCQNATTMQLWRRVGEFPDTPPECVTGMPDGYGYTKIADLPIKTTSYSDSNGGKGLAIGAQYCYRLVAVFPAPGGGESYVSQEICLPPIKVTAPVITNVTVDKTAVEGGQITVRWTSPFEIDKAQFPPPYEYQVFRAEGMTGDVKLAPLTPGRQTDTVFVDQNDPDLNIEDLSYNYRIFAFDANGNALPEHSDSASTVRLEARPQLAKIDLMWTAEVPWSLKSDVFQTHDIYRGGENDPDEALVFIASVNVNTAGFAFTDDGSFNATPLDENTIYCYKVLTRGTYGNDLIPTPLINYSQKICAQPNDNVAPCKPDLKVKDQTCDDKLNSLSCGFSISNNVITWTRPTDPACRNDVVSYNVYVSLKKGMDFNLLAENIRDTVFVHSGLSSSARCYKIEAVDRSGNKSELSEQFCFDNCPYYELPNVFTPGGIDECNQYFSAFSDRVVVDENGIGPCNAPVDLVRIREKCARYVQAVEFRVYNRWGREVYNYTGDIFGTGGEKSIYIDWDGKDSQGQDLSEGIYYYVAEVTYDVVDPSQAVQSLKGWVHLVR
jgi:hypothetical protein